MSAIYDMGENVFGCFRHNQHFIGFTQGKEKELIQAVPLQIRSHTLQPGDKITGFYSGAARTSYPITKGVYMTYHGRFGLDALFELSNENTGKIGTLFQERPRWFVAFGYYEGTDRFFMHSSPATSWDIVPKQIEYFKN